MSGHSGVPPPRPNSATSGPSSIEAKAGPPADVVAPLLTAETTVKLPARVDLLRVGDAVTSLDLRP